MFDVSHMGRVYISGPGSAEFLDWVLTGSAATLRVGRARYCLICNERGGVIDDTIFYRLADDRFLLIPNAGNRETVVAWLQRWIDERFPGACTLDDQTAQTALIAVQGPAAPSVLDRLCENPVSGVRPFAWTAARLAGADALLGRTGYTGEDGFEILCGSEDAVNVWTALQQTGVAPCGLGARDVLRLEAGLPLHGHEIDEKTTPIEAGLHRFVRFDKGIRRLRGAAPATRRGHGADAGGAAIARTVGPPSGLHAVARRGPGGERYQRQLLAHA